MFRMVFYSIYLRTTGQDKNVTADPPDSPAKKTISLQPHSHCLIIQNLVAPAPAHINITNAGSTKAGVLKLS